MEDLDALLADLQNQTQLNLTSATCPTSPSSNSYAAIMSRPPTTTVTKTITTERYEYRNGTPDDQPIYQNQHAIKSAMNEQRSGAKPDFASNLSELDSLLEDLNSARYANYPAKKGYQTPSYNIYNNETSPSKLPTNGTPEPVRPTVDSLLDELQSGLPDTPKQQISSSVKYKQSYHAPPMISSVSSFPPNPQTVESSAPTASSATKELDDLMASLSDFKHTQPKTSEAQYAKPNKVSKSPTSTSKGVDQLDSMLGTLQSDMSKQGVNTSPKGHCTACNKPIVGQVVTALGKTWHKEHFVCGHCHQELGTKNFFERDGVPYCETDYHNIFSPKCAYCNAAILGKCITALEKTWHPEHFFCTQCGKQFGEDGFHEKDGKPYCRDDYLEMFALKCAGCNRPITENYISAMNSQWHPGCFACRDCRQPFNGGSFFDHDGQPYCELHYHAKRGSLCAGCHKPISGRCVTAMSRKFHPEHFVCSFCLKQLNKGTFKEQNDKPYCHPCFEKLFA
jgi:paxillin